MGNFVLDPNTGNSGAHSQLKMINFHSWVTYKDIYSKAKSTNIPLGRLLEHSTNVYRMKRHCNQPRATSRLWLEPIIQLAVYNSFNYTQSLLLQGCLGFLFFGALFFFKQYFSTR